MNHTISDNDLAEGYHINFSKSGMTREILSAIASLALIIIINYALYFWGYYHVGLIAVTTVVVLYILYTIIRNFSLYNSGNPALIISNEGLFENIQTKRWIEWHEIRKCYVIKKGLFDFLVFDFKDAKAFQEQSDWTDKLLFYNNNLTFQSPIALQNTFFDENLADIAAKINQKINK